MASMSECRSNFAAVIFNDAIVAIGGYNGSQRLSSVESFSFDTETWTAFPAMTTARVGHSAAVHDGKIYVIGGKDTDSVEMFDPAAQRWELSHDIKIKRFGSTLVQL